MVDNGVRQYRPLHAVWWLLFVALSLAELVVAIETALHFGGSAIDGPFQLYNALRRIADGQRPGVDFQFFHGVGVPYVHYWLFRLFGGHFASSELARETLSAVVVPLSLLVVFRAFGRGWTRAACLATGALALMFVLRMPALLFAMNSMIGLRSTLPTLVAAVLYVAASRRTRVGGTGVVMGLSLFVSTEQGLAVVGAFIIISIIAVVRGPNRQREAIDAGITLLIALAVLYGALVLVGGFAGAAGALRYNFKLVPMDQYWFFGAPPNAFAGSWAMLWRFAVGIPLAGLALLLGFVATIAYCIAFWRAPREAFAARERATALLATYGLLSCASLLGVFTQVYSFACWRALLILVFLELARRADAGDASSAEALGAPRAAAIGAFAAAALAFATVPLLVVSLLRGLPHVIEDHLVHGHGMRITSFWARALATDDSLMRVHSRDGRPPVLWSTYTGWAEARIGEFNPSFDYIIHALGPDNRRAYVRTFARTRPDLVQTVAPGYTQYEPWLENTHWEFYRDLLSSYVVATRTPWSFVWERRTDSLPPARSLGGAELPPGTTEVALPPIPDVGLPVVLLEVEVEYRASNALHWLPIVGPMPRYLVGIIGAVTHMPIPLDPYTSIQRFPLLARPGDRPTLQFRAFSLLPGAGLSVRRVRLSVVPIDPRNRSWLSELVARAGHQ